MWSISPEAGMSSRGAAAKPECRSSSSQACVPRLRRFGVSGWLLEDARGGQNDYYVCEVSLLNGGGWCAGFAGKAQKRVRGSAVGQEECKSERLPDWPPQGHPAVVCSSDGPLPSLLSAPAQRRLCRSRWPRDSALPFHGQRVVGFGGAERAVCRCLPRKHAREVVVHLVVVKTL